MGTLWCGLQRQNASFLHVPATCSDTSATNACMPAVGELRRLECLNLSFTGVPLPGL